MDNIETFAAILQSGISVSIVTGAIILTQFVKTLPIEERFLRWIPAFTFFIGFIFTFIYFGWYVGVILPAIFIGASSLGIYDIGKKTILGK